MIYSISNTRPTNFLGKIVHFDPSKSKTHAIKNENCDTIELNTQANEILRKSKSVIFEAKQAHQYCKQQQEEAYVIYDYCQNYREDLEKLLNLSAQYDFTKLKLEDGRLIYTQTATDKNGRQYPVSIGLYDKDGNIIISGIVDADDESRIIATSEYIEEGEFKAIFNGDELLSCSISSQTDDADREIALYIEFKNGELRLNIENQRNRVYEDEDGITHTENSTENYVYFCPDGTIKYEKNLELNSYDDLNELHIDTVYTIFPDFDCLVEKDANRDLDGNIKTSQVYRIEQGELTEYQKDHTYDNASNTADAGEIYAYNRLGKFVKVKDVDKYLRYGVVY